MLSLHAWVRIACSGDKPVSLFGIDMLPLGTVERGDDYTDRYRSIYRSIDLSAVVPIPYWPRVPLLHISRIMLHGWLSQL